MPALHLNLSRACCTGYCLGQLMSSSLCTTSLIPRLESLFMNKQGEKLHREHAGLACAHLLAWLSMDNHTCTQARAHTHTHTGRR